MLGREAGQQLLTCLPVSASATAYFPDPLYPWYLPLVLLDPLPACLRPYGCSKSRRSGVGQYLDALCIMHMQLKRPCVVAAAVASLQCLCSKAFVQPFSQHRAKQGIWPHQYSCKSTSLPVQQRTRSYHVSMMTETTSDTSPGRKDEVLAVLSAVMDPGEMAAI